MEEMQKQMEERETEAGEINKKESGMKGAEKEKQSDLNL